ncbi:hypothetical protein FB446DRAFT_849504 [Lentinula raphanica]|nr:hypothetical protein FB446DRAFT_849504 [Lentinula raphanica]
MTWEIADCHTLNLSPRLPHSLPTRRILSDTLEVVLGSRVVTLRALLVFLILRLLIPHVHDCFQAWAPFFLLLEPISLILLPHKSPTQGPRFTGTGNTGYGEREQLVQTKISGPYVKQGLGPNPGFDDEELDAELEVEPERREGYFSKLGLEETQTREDHVSQAQVQLLRHSQPLELEALEANMNHRRKGALVVTCPGYNIARLFHHLVQSQSSRRKPFHCLSLRYQCGQDFRNRDRRTEGAQTLLHEVCVHRMSESAQYAKSNTEKQSKLHRQIGVFVGCSLAAVVPSIIQKRTLERMIFVSTSLENRELFVCSRLHTFLACSVFSLIPSRPLALSRTWQ